MSPALAGRFSTTVPPGKPQTFFITWFCQFISTIAPILKMSQKIGFKGQWAKSTALAWPAIAKYHKLSVLNNRNLFITVLEAGVWNQGTRIIGFWWELTSWLADCHLLAVFLQGRERASKYLGVSSYKGTNPIMRVPPPWPILTLITFQRPHVQLLLHWRLGLQHMNLRETQTFSP